MKKSRQHKSKITLATLALFGGAMLLQQSLFISSRAFAAEQSNSDNNVSVIIPPVLTITLTESVDINVKSNAISTGNFVAKVTSNAPYTISLSATQNGHTDLQSAENGSIPASNDVKAGESGWGIKCIGTNCVNDSGTGILNTRYNALTAYGTPKIYFDSPTVAANQETSFEVGIGVNSSLASGTYATDVLVTAAQK